MDRRSPHPDITKRGLVKITLECGDQITARNPPLNDRAKYMCVAGKGCSYNQQWVSYQNHGSGRRTDNPLIEAEQQTG